MSSDPKPQARKRGRPANATKSPTTSASRDRPDEYEADNEEPVLPKQRGRPMKLAQENATEEIVAKEGKPRKKRGRPSLEDKNTEKREEDAPLPKKKRGRPSLERNQDEQEPEPQAVDEMPRKRKRGRPSLGKNKNNDMPEPEPEPDQEGVEEEAQAKKTRGRSKTNRNIEDLEQQAEGNEKQLKRKRGRPSHEKVQNDQEPVQEVAQNSENPQSKKKTKGNQVEQPDEQQEELEPEPEESQPAHRKKRQRKAPEPELEEQEPEEEEQQVTRDSRNSLDNARGDVNKKGRKAKKSNKTTRASQEIAEDQQPDEPTKKRGRRRGGKPPADEADEPEPEPEPEPEQQGQHNKKKRRNKNDVPSDLDGSLPSPPKPYLHIAPFKRTIRSSHIAVKWSPLTGSSLPAATSILALAQRPILQRTATTRNRRDHATAALNLVSRRIERKLDRGVPFPAASSTTSTRRRADADGGRAMELDFEAVLDGKQALERQLHPAKHAVGLLKVERDRMEKELENDYEVLRGLEANARAQTRERKDLFRKAHVLAPILPPKNQGHDTQFVTNKDEGSLKELLETPLEPLALQLAGHVDSIRGNLQQAEGVTPQLNRTKAALQDVLQEYLDSDMYEQVLLG
ncbi:hypothetical protein FPOAC2_09418 [Fusarium poae]|uniref:Kinetochore protein fta7 n=1 Tax=Fusarium poae TaxID=36050 RepID=A0A1B8ANY8_FUSPO|nr:hypothetical protein FPOAC1_009480 [Fusarium poae]KAG8670077.1 hypothetical protein FPOAC1_009480 [Fusarium poae]OBS22279.1 hypothetical protein FPOA_08615 [Fusarium poae]